MSENIILQTRNLKKYYGKGETQVHALDGVNLKIRLESSLPLLALPALVNLLC